jgi:hypothetical protein
VDTGESSVPSTSSQPGRGPSPGMACLVQQIRTRMMQASSRPCRGLVVVGATARVDGFWLPIRDCDSGCQAGGDESNGGAAQTRGCLDQKGEGRATARVVVTESDRRVIVAVRKMEVTARARDPPKEHGTDRGAQAITSQREGSIHDGQAHTPDFQPPTSGMRMRTRDRSDRGEWQRKTITCCVWWRS